MPPDATLVMPPNRVVRWCRCRHRAAGPTISLKPEPPARWCGRHSDDGVATTPPEDKAQPPDRSRAVHDAAGSTSPITPLPAHPDSARDLERPGAGVQVADDRGACRSRWRQHCVDRRRPIRSDAAAADDRAAGKARRDGLMPPNEITFRCQPARSTSWPPLLTIMPLAVVGGDQGAASNDVATPPLLVTVSLPALRTSPTVGHRQR